jgi:hypothetical protein
VFAEYGHSIFADHRAVILALRAELKGAIRLYDAGRPCAIAQRRKQYFAAGHWLSVASDGAMDFDHLRAATGQNYNG